MKRTLIIILGIILVIILMTVWVLILLRPDTGEEPTLNFGNFDFGTNPEPTVVVAEPEPIAEDEPQGSTDTPDALRQLTTKPVIGYRILGDTSTTSEITVRYVEAGTGHIYEINLTTGNEVRLSGTTIPLATNAVIGTSGELFIISAGSGQAVTHHLGRLNQTEESLDFTIINEQIEQPYVTRDNQFLYTVDSGNESLARQYDPVNNTITTLFSIPFRDAIVSWGTTVTEPHFVYPPASFELEGAVYVYENDTFTRESVDGFGLSVVGDSDYILSSTRKGTTYTSAIYNRTSSETRELPFAAIPEKCIISPVADALAACAITLQEYGTEMPNQWYRGELPMSDGLWEVNLHTAAISSIQNISDVAGRDIDVVGLEFSTSGQYLLFTNRNERTLWMYDLAL